MPETLTPSHQVIPTNDGKVMIKDLELFVGFDPSIDDPGNKKLRKYDNKGVGKIVTQTRTYMERGQRPKLILGHNDPDNKAPGFVKPVVGDVVNVRLQDINGAPGIVGDIEMSAHDFENYIRSNAYPRRSAEIWPDGFMSEVALLGSETPARPLRDTRFSQSELMSTGPELFTRDAPVLQFAEEAKDTNAAEAHPGPGNVYIPSHPKKRKDENQMADDDKDKTPTKDELRKRLNQLDEERDKLKAQMDEMGDDDKDKDKDKDEPKDKSCRDTDDNARGDMPVQFRRELQKRDTQIQALTRNLTREQFHRRMEDAAFNGAVFGDVEQFNKLLDRVANAADPEAEFEFITGLVPTAPVGGPHIPHRELSTRQPGADQMQRNKIESEAADEAVARCGQEGKSDNYDKYYQEGIDKRTGG